MTPRMAWLVVGCLAGGWGTPLAMAQAPANAPLKETRRTEVRQRWSTETQETERVYQIPITEYALEPHNANWWIPFARPHYVYHYVPRTRLEMRTEKVRVQVPVSRPVTVEITEREVMSAPSSLPNAPSAARTTDARKNTTSLPSAPGAPPAVATDTGWRVRNRGRY